jgi:hypothetical protein
MKVVDWFGAAFIQFPGHWPSSSAPEPEVHCPGRRVSATDLHVVLQKLPKRDFPTREGPLVITHRFGPIQEQVPGSFPVGMI